MSPVEDSPLEPCPTQEDRSFGAGLLHGPLESLHRALVDDRPEKDVAFRGVAHSNRAGPFDEALDERAVYLALHVDPRGGAALLILQAERRPHDALGRGVEIGAAQHDGGVLPAELQQRRLDPSGAETRVDPHTDLFGSGEHDAIDARVLPATRAAEDIPADRASGKLNGAMQAKTP